MGVGRPGEPPTMDAKARAELDRAVARNVALVLSLPSAGMMRHCKSRFLDCDDGGIVIESVRSERILLESLAGTGALAAVSFKSAFDRVMFAAPIARLLDDHPISAELSADALLVGFPQSVKIIHRRTHYRVALGTGADWSIRVWRMPPRARLGDRPATGSQVMAELLDLSVGGAGVILVGQEGAAPKVDPGDRLRVELSRGEQTLLIEGKMRLPARGPRPDRVRAGLQFIGLETDMTGRQTSALLTRIVGELQREELRRTRLGLVG